MNKKNEYKCVKTTVLLQLLSAILPDKDNLRMGAFRYQLPPFDVAAPHRNTPTRTWTSTHLRPYPYICKTFRRYNKTKCHPPHKQNRSLSDDLPEPVLYGRRVILVLLAEQEPDELRVAHLVLGMLHAVGALHAPRYRPAEDALDHARRQS